MNERNDLREKLGKNIRKGLAETVAVYQILTRPARRFHGPRLFAIRCKPQDSCINFVVIRWAELFTLRVALKIKGKKVTFALSSGKFLLKNFLIIIISNIPNAFLFNTLESGILSSVFFNEIFQLIQHSSSSNYSWRRYFSIITFPFLISFYRFRSVRFSIHFPFSNSLFFFHFQRRKK